jgi:hypothetical protein
MKRFFQKLIPRSVRDVKYAAWLPWRAGAVLGIAQYQDGLLIACEGGVFRLRNTCYGSDSDFVIEQVMP